MRVGENGAASSGIAGNQYTVALPLVHAPRILASQVALLEFYTHCIMEIAMDCSLTSDVVKNGATSFVSPQYTDHGKQYFVVPLTKCTSTVDMTEGEGNLFLFLRLVCLLHIF